MEILKSIPVGGQVCELLAETANGLNEVLVDVGLWLEVVHSRNEAFLVLIRVTPEVDAETETLPPGAAGSNESSDRGLP